MSEPEYASLVWHKSSASAFQGNCVEVAFGPESVYVRHSEHSYGLVLRFQHLEWAAFLLRVHNGEFDLPAPQITPESD